MRNYSSYSSTNDAKFHENQFINEKFLLTIQLYLAAVKNFNPPITQGKIECE